MKYFIPVLFLLCAQISTADSFFFQLEGESDMSAAKIEGETLHVAIKFKKLPLPMVLGIEVEADSNGSHIIRSYLRVTPEQSWHPMIKLDARILPDNIRVTIHEAKYASYFEIVVPDKKEAETIARSLAALLEVPEGKLVLKAP